MRLKYFFVGGKLNGTYMDRSEVDQIAEGLSPNKSAERAAGRLVQRAELDEQPLVPGYLGPMWDGKRYILDDGRMDYPFNVDDLDRVVEILGVIRYETQQVYDMLSR